MNQSMRKGHLSRRQTANPRSLHRAFEFAGRSHTIWESEQYVDKNRRSGPTGCMMRTQH